jgi:hypothetical protein
MVIPSDVMMYYSVFEKIKKGEKVNKKRQYTKDILP